MVVPWPEGFRSAQERARSSEVAEKAWQAACESGWEKPCREGAYYTIRVTLVSSTPTYCIGTIHGRNAEAVSEDASFVEYAQFRCSIDGGVGIEDIL